MAFCHECGSEVSSDEAFCSVCGIALHNPVLEDLQSEDEAPADVSSESGAAAAPASGEEEGPIAASEPEAAKTAEPVVPEDEFVDISALRDDDDDIPGVPLREKGPEPEPVPDGDFVDISALRDDETDVSPPEVVSEESEEQAEVIAEIPAEAAETEPPEPRILAEEEKCEPALSDTASAPDYFEDAETEIEDEAGNVDETPIMAPEAAPVAETFVPSDSEDVPSFEPEVAPSAEIAEPSAEIAEPSAEIAEPSAEIAEPSAEIAEPSAEIAEPSVEIAEPSLGEDAPAAVESVETPVTEIAEPSAIDQVPDAIASIDEPLPELPKASEELPGTAAGETVEEVAGGEPPSVASEPEAEPVPDEAPGFLEDATLIAMPIPAFKPEPPVPSPAAPEEPAAGEHESQPVMTEAGESEAPVDLVTGSEPSHEAAAESQPDPQQMTEEPAFEEAVPHSEDGETTLEEGVAPDAGLPVPDEEPARHQTTPNIGGADTDGSRAPKLKPLTEGTVLNSRYEIVRKIGGGGMGAVYLASDKNLGGVLRAVKEMVQSYIEEDQQEKAVQDFKRESMLLTSLEHPSIPTIYDYFFDETAHRFYLVMKYISGGDLAAKLRSATDGKLSEEEVTEWAIQIADVLDYLHNRQPPIVYRDLKPANIMLDGNSGKVMLIDFGIARWINKEEKGVTAVGTMGYAPPELFSGNVVPSSDIYSLGSTMFHLLTGADPQNNPLLIFDFEKNPKPRQINSRLSDQIESILMRSVEYNAEKRFTNAAEMRDALTEHLARLNAGTITYGKTESPKSVGFSDQSVFCGFCGQKIVATDMFCAFCGAKQPLAQPGVQSQEYIPVRLTAKLLIEGTSQLDYPSFELAKDENLVGRRDPMSNIFPEVDLSKFDPQTKISRKHARIFRDGDNFMLEDLGSSNGTILIPPTNESMRLTPHQAQVLTHGDRIKLGDTMLHFVVTA